MSVLHPRICQTPLLHLQYKENQEVKKSSKERWSIMTTLTINKVCIEHTPNKSAISDVADTQFTFCEMCENNIERYYYDGDPERLPEWTDWYVSK
jgi:hypothetical protein